MNKLLAACCVVMLLHTGCNLGDRAPASKTVFLSFPAKADGSTIGLSVDSTQVQEAISLVDKILVGDGFVCDTNPPNKNTHGMISSYSRLTESGLKSVGGPSVFYRNSQLEIVVVEGGNLNDSISAGTTRVCELLRSELVKQYGDKRVKIRRNN
jgi:hypothetical protein